MIKDPAVTSVISEMLIIALVVMLIPTVTITLMYQLPETRSPTVNLKMTSLASDGTIKIYHKGGDAIRGEDIKIIVGNTEVTMTGAEKEHVYDVGDSIPFSHNIPAKKGDGVNLIIKNSVFPVGMVTE